MKTALALLSVLFVSSPAFASEFGHPFARHERREIRVGRELARERAFERFRIGRFERGRLYFGRDCGRF